MSLLSLGLRRPERELCKTPFAYLGKIHVAAELALAVSVHTYVYNHRTVLYHIGGYKVRLTDGGNKNVGATCNLFEIFVLEWQIVTVPFC